MSIIGATLYETEKSAAKTLHEVLMEYLYKYPQQDVKAIDNLFEKDMQEYKIFLKNLSVKTISEEDPTSHLQDDIDECIKLLSNFCIDHTTSMKKLSGMLFCLASIMSPDYNVKNLEGPIPKILPGTYGVKLVTSKALFTKVKTSWIFELNIVTIVPNERFGQL